ncbi:hypothetical protein I4Q42_16860 [Caulobacter hibisci]|uniref:Secreted protein n=1 Tax=Caulobacter hibisci TaxID=2035993 RepID=A0ABS0T0F4_9CAUL|nr:hypothetical protein [Caulobacter hibisci]
MLLLELLELLLDEALLELLEPLELEPPPPPQAARPAVRAIAMQVAARARRRRGPSMVIGSSQTFVLEGSDERRSFPTYVRRDKVRGVWRDKIADWPSIRL